MKNKKALVGGVLMGLFLSVGHAQNIGWKNVTSGNNNTYGTSNGTTTYQQIGNSTFGSDGTNSQRIGNTNFNSDGSRSTQIGNTQFNSDGSSGQRIGNSYFGSDGTRCNIIGNQTICN